jgi:hypothetical protein
VLRSADTWRYTYPDPSPFATGQGSGNPGPLPTNSFPARKASPERPVEYLGLSFRSSPDSFTSTPWSAASRNNLIKRGTFRAMPQAGMAFSTDFGSWFIDPGRNAEKSVSIDKRLDIPVLRQRIHDLDKQKQPGQTLDFQWDVGKCSRDLFGNQEVESRTVTYKKGLS